MKNWESVLKKACDKMKKYSGLIVALLICVVIAVAGFYLYSLRITEFSFSGNTLRYSDEELKNLIFTKDIESNPLYIMFVDKQDKEIPFVAKYEIDVEWPDKANVTVYGKDIVGYVYYKDFYIYFDKDGIVVELSNELLEDVILMEGLEFGQMVLYQKLPAKKEESFSLILSLTKMIKKNEIAVDKVVFDSELNMTVYIGDIKVILGKDEYLDEKLTKVKVLLPSLEGYTGVLNLENYREGNNSFWFRQNGE